MKVQTILLILAAFLFNNCAPKKSETFSNGDVIFQQSLSSQSKAIQLATKSPYSHVGILYNKKGDWYVLEAVQPVKITLLSEWQQQGKGNHYVVKRLKNADKLLTASVFQKMELNARKYLGKPYDLYFGWSDDKIYCSELVYKLYKETLGIELGKVQKLCDFDLSHEAVKKKLKERYGNKIPCDEKVISPGAIFDSEQLVEVLRN